MDPVHIVMAGASGFLGTALRAHLALAGHTVTQLVRGQPTTPSQSNWDPYVNRLDTSVLDGTDTVINLAGIPLAHWPWTSSYRRQIVESRVETTTTLADAVAARAPGVALVNGSGINYYGADRGDEQLDEGSAPGNDFLADVCHRWEGATTSASEAGARVAMLRTAVVLDRSGGALKSLLLPFRLGVGGRLGSGKQWFATISLGDWLAATTRLVTDSSLRGPFNLVAPVSATNAEFTAALGQRIHRPTRLAVPSLGINAALGEFGSTLTGGVHALPRKLTEAGFEFSHPTIKTQLEAALS
jgi:uncharacterized protein (TIGR01777 family)